MKFSAHLDMFWKHFKENMKTIFPCLYYRTYCSNHYIILRNNDSLPNCQGFFTRSSKMFLNKMFISIRVRKKIPTLFLRKHGKTIPQRYQQLVIYSCNIAGKTHLFSLEMLIKKEWTKKCYIKLWDSFPNFLWYFLITFWKCFYSTVLYSLGSS